MFQPVHGPGVEAIWAKCLWLLRASPKKFASGGARQPWWREVVRWPSATAQSFEMLANALVGAPACKVPPTQNTMVGTAKKGRYELLPAYCACGPPRSPNPVPEG